MDTVQKPSNSDRRTKFRNESHALRECDEPVESFYRSSGFFEGQMALLCNAVTTGVTSPGASKTVTSAADINMTRLLK
jgi:hypothetical protein